MESYVPGPGPGLWTVAEGAGYPVLFIPGGPGCCDYLEPVSSAVEGIRAIRFDPRGCGRSERVAEYRLADTIGDIERLRLHYGIERWVVAGHSAGADHALAYALEHGDRVAGIVCLSGGRVHNDREWHAAYSAAREAGLEPQLDFDYPPNLDVNRQLNAEWKLFIKRPGLLHELATFDIPALFIYGSEDIRPAWPVEQVARLLPNGHWKMLPGANHNLWLSHRDEVGELIGAFVASVS